MKFKHLLQLLREKWVEYDYNYGEDKKEGKKINKKYRNLFDLPKDLPGEIDLTNKKK